MENYESTGLLRAEYESLIPENKKKFLELVSKKDLRTLTEEQFWGNFQILCDYMEVIGSSEEVPVAAIRAGFYTYEYLNRRLTKLARDHRMTPECEMFYKKVRESFAEDYFDCFAMGGQKELFDEEINRMMEAYVKNMFLLIANKNRDSSKIGVNSIDYTWEDFRKDIKRGIVDIKKGVVNKKIKKGYLTERKRLLLVKMEKDKLNFSCARDTYVYCAIALYYMKNLQERWK